MLRVVGFPANQFLLSFSHSLLQSGPLVLFDKEDIWSQRSSLNHLTPHLFRIPEAPTVGSESRYPEQAREDLSN